MTGPQLRLGTRASQLARAQAALVADALAGMEVDVELVPVTTSGDVRSPDTAWGEGAFVDALESALRDGRIDAAVHSAKDVPVDRDAAADLLVAAYLRRADPRDALILREDAQPEALVDVPEALRVGTDSPRRTGFLLAQRPDLRVRPLSGNVDTRLRRLDEGEVDALVLAVAGLVRLGREGRIGMTFDPGLMPPAPGQGALAVQVRAEDTRSREIVAHLDDASVREAVEVERAVLTLLGGGCHAPIGALATIDAGRLTVVAGRVEPDGSAARVGTWTGTQGAGLGLATAAAEALR
jgi:hydroxymethylbilane synthase